VSRLRETLRQRRQYRAFRIGEPRWTEEQCAELDGFVQALTVLAATTEPDADAAYAVQEEEHPPVSESVADKALAEAATNLWRAQRKLSGSDATTQSRQAGRYLRTCREALTDAGLVVQDHEGDAFHPGRSLEVLVYEEDPALTVETVLETVRPSIYYRDRRIQMGQVIVGRPKSTDQRGNHA
jgi:hypothetical protein